MTSKRLLKMKDAANYVGLCPDELRLRIAKGRFPFLNIGSGEKKIYRFDQRELDLWIEQLPGLKVGQLPNV